MVDNCYGEFVDTIEPSDVGADIMVGSLIKNPGGGLAPIGGYIAGRKDCVENASYRMTCPGLGMEVGATLGVNRSLYQGFFLAPMVTKGALKGAVFAANIYEKLGFPVVPNSTEATSGYHPGSHSWNTGRSCSILSGYSGCCSGRQFCNTGAVGYARL